MSSESTASAALKRKIFVRTSALIVLVVLLIAAALSYHAVADQRALEKQQALATARFLADRSRLFLIHDDLDNLTALLQQLVQSHRITRYAVVERDGVLLAADGQGELPPAMDHSTHSSLSKAQISTQRNPAGEVLFDAVVAVPGTQAAVHIGVQQRDIDTQTWGRIRVVGLYSLLALVLGLLLAWAVAQVTSREVDRAEHALQESEKRYRTLFDLAPDSIFLLDMSDPEDLTILEANEATARVHGYTREEIIGQSIKMLDAPHDGAQVAERARRLRNGEALKFEVEHLRKDGTVFPMEVLAQQIELDGRPVIQSIDRDISERRQAETEKLQLEAQLQQAQKMEAIGQLAGGIAHDMNNVLGSIMGAASLLELKAEEMPEFKELVGSILVASRRGQDLTSNFLGFARKGKYTRERFSLNQVVQETHDLLARTIPKRIGVELKLDPSLFCVEGDRGQIGHAMMNACINAVDAMKERGTLTVHTHNIEVDAETPPPWSELEPGLYTQIQIRDDGTGMDPDTLARAFEPFFTTKAAGEGTGLGLSMVYGTLQNHGGHVHIDSSPGQGTTVWLVLPGLDCQAPGAIAETPQPTEQRGTEIAPRSEPGGGAVLLIDDEKLIRWAGQQMLESLGYTVLLAEDGREGVELYRENRALVSLVILDLIMPVLDGVETFAILKALDPDLRVLISSGYSKDDKVEKLLADGARGFIQKPFDLDQLARQVAEMLEN